MRGGIVEIEQEIWRRQMEKMHGMRLQGLAVVHQPADLLGGRRNFLGADQLIHGLCCGQMVADRADAAQPLHQHRHLPVGPTLDEFLETAKFDDVQPCLANAMILVHQQRHLAVPFDPAQRIDGDPAQILRPSGRFQSAHG